MVFREGGGPDPLPPSGSAREKHIAPSNNIGDSLTIIYIFYKRIQDEALQLSHIAYHEDLLYMYHASEPLYSNNAVIAGVMQSTKAHNTLFWGTVIHSIAISLQLVFYMILFSFGIIIEVIAVYSGSKEAFKFKKKLAKY